MAENKIKDDVLKQAVREYTEEKLNSNIYKEDEYLASDKFNKSIDKMIKSENNVFHKLTLTKLRKILCVAAIIIALIAASLTVESVRSFFTNIFDNSSSYSNIESVSEPQKHKVLTSAATQNNNRYLNENNKHKDEIQETSSIKINEYPTKLEKIYQFGFVPEGYELAVEEIFKKNTLFTYINQFDTLIFEQQTKDFFSNSIDKDYSKHSETYNGQKFDVYRSNVNDTTLLVWDNGEYIFNMSSQMSKESMYKLYDSLIVRKETEDNNENSKEKEKTEATNTTEVKSKNDIYLPNFKIIYELSSVPNGYELTDKDFSDNCLSYTYKNDNNELVYKQYLKGLYTDDIAQEYTDKLQEYHNAQSFTIYYNNDKTTILWSKGDYELYLSGNTSKSVLFKLYDLIRVIEL